LHWEPCRHSTRLTRRFAKMLWNRIDDLGVTLSFRASTDGFNPITGSYERKHSVTFAETVQGRWSLQILESTKSAAVLIGHALPVDVVSISLGLHIPYFKYLHRSQELHYSRQSRQGQSNSTSDAPSCSSIGGLHQLPRADHQPSFVRIPTVVYLACFRNRCASKATSRQFNQQRGEGSTNCEINRNLRYCSRRVICLFSPACVGQVLPEFSILP
jgi:hypothetical protein